MNAHESKVALEIMKRIMRRPVSALFNSNATSPLTLSDISARMNLGLFASVDSWKTEVNNFFDRFVKNPSSDECIVACAHQLKNEFNSHLDNLLPMNRMSVYPVAMLQEHLSSVAKEFAPSAQIVDAEPAAVLFTHKNEEVVDIRRLERDIKMFHSSEVVLRVAACLVAHQPESVVIGDGKVMFDFTMLKDDVVVKLRAFVTDLLRQIARGEVDPFRADVDLLTEKANQ